LHTVTVTYTVRTTPWNTLTVPSGYGQEALMEDAEVLGWIRQQASGACNIFSVCTGALICGAAGLLNLI